MHRESRTRRLGCRAEIWQPREGALRQRAWNNDEQPHGTDGWQTGSKKPVKNADLWQQLDDATAPHEVEWHWVKGHAGHPENERADQLAVRGAQEALGGRADITQPSTRPVQRKATSPQLYGDNSRWPAVSDKRRRIRAVPRSRPRPAVWRHAAERKAVHRRQRRRPLCAPPRHRRLCRPPRIVSGLIPPSSLLGHSSGYDVFTPICSRTALRWIFWSDTWRAEWV